MMMIAGFYSKNGRWPNPGARDEKEALNTSRVRVPFYSMLYYAETIASTKNHILRIVAVLTLSQRSVLARFMHVEVVVVVKGIIMIVLVVVVEDVVHVRLEVQRSASESGVLSLVGHGPLHHLVSKTKILIDPLFNSP
jgi:hypothetical protein